MFEDAERQAKCTEAVAASVKLREILNSLWEDSAEALNLYLEASGPKNKNDMVKIAELANNVKTLSCMILSVDQVIGTFELAQDEEGKIDVSEMSSVENLPN